MKILYRPSHLKTHFTRRTKVRISSSIASEQFQFHTASESAMENDTAPYARTRRKFRCIPSWNESSVYKSKCICKGNATCKAWRLTPRRCFSVGDRGDGLNSVPKVFADSISESKLLSLMFSNQRGGITHQPTHRGGVFDSWNTGGGFSYPVLNI